jgi:glycosyltransferase involved in cell wall biosynthesis
MAPRPPVPNSPRTETVSIAIEQIKNEHSAQTMRLPEFKKLSILMAAYNEEESLRTCVAAVLAAPLPRGLERELVIVNDGSRDATWEVMQELAGEHPQTIRVFSQPQNMGKGAAIRRAIAEMSGDLAILQDADLEYDPAEYPKMLAPILDGRAEVVFGSRFAGAERKVLLFWHTAMNKLLTTLSNMLNDTNWTDMETCYKAFTSAALKAMPLFSNRFGIEPELAAKVARNRFRMFEVPINYNGRSYDEGKKIGWKDGIAALWFIFKYRFSSKYSDAGKVTLDAIECAPKFNRWMYERVKPWLGKRVAELGCGRGNMSNFIRRHEKVMLTDYRDDYLDPLRAKWGQKRNLTFTKLDMTVREDYRALTTFAPDTVVFLNVLEHIEDDRAVLKNLFDHVPAQSRIVVLVPFGMTLFSEFDRELGHFRRYEKGELESKMREAGFNVEHQFYFNKAGKIAWFISNTLFKRRKLTPLQLRIYNFLTPAFRLWDRIAPGTGLSTVAICRKP